MTDRLRFLVCEVGEHAYCLRVIPDEYASPWVCECECHEPLRPAPRESPAALRAYFAVTDQAVEQVLAESDQLLAEIQALLPPSAARLGRGAE